jgi:hypothetical protein
VLAFRVAGFVDETRQVGIPKNKESPLRASPRGERHLVVPEGIPVSGVFRLAALFRDSTGNLIRAAYSIRSVSPDVTGKDRGGRIPFHLWWCANGAWSCCVEFVSVKVFRPFP